MFTPGLPLGNSPSPFRAGGAWRAHLLDRLARIHGRAGQQEDRTRPSNHGEPPGGPHVPADLGHEAGQSHLDKRVRVQPLQPPLSQHAHRQGLRVPDWTGVVPGQW